MRTISIIFNVLMGISLYLATTAGNVIQGLTANYTIEELQWDVPVSSGRNDTVTGTIQDVVRHLQAVAPERLAALNISTAEPIDVSSLFNVPAIKTAKPSKVLCNIFDDQANGITIAQGMYYLRGIVGSPKNGPGPGACGQVSCSYNSAIWWCNDVSLYGRPKEALVHVSLILQVQLTYLV
ncbi:hypothetical protein N8I77_004726 [Diaporthe amygdali]|uniref:Uncharacterized protein n=1 Tax=Phomopsis amygdali TaxID=1214568 RepID=A0AAD9SMW5_PHOAM|nr:hypothetical protein N8I77_004726 [Diaporthe amygdali]